MKKYIFGAVLALGLIVSPAFTQAAGLTSSQIQSILSLLSSFGASQSVIDNVNVALGGTSGGGSATAFCHNFTTDLTIGSTDRTLGEITDLYQALVLSGINTSTNTGTFDEDTAAAVVQFQAKYGIKQTGYVGPMTRAKLNSLYGCSTQSVQPVTVDLKINGSDGPLTLVDNQKITASWTSNGTSCYITNVRVTPNAPNQTVENLSPSGSRDFYVALSDGNNGIIAVQCGQGSDSVQTSLSPTIPAPTTLKGDVDSNGTVDQSDVGALYSYYLGGSRYLTNPMNGDMDGNGKIELSDVQTLQAQVKAANPAPTVTITASPTSVTAGQSTTLTWSSTNTTSCSLNGGASLQPSGSTTVTPTANPTTYAIYCTGPGGVVSKNVSVSVVAASTPVPTLTITGISPGSGTIGTAVTVYGSGFNSDSTVLIGDNITSVKPSYVSSDGTKLSFVLPSVALSQPISTPYSIRVSNSGNVSVGSGLASNYLIFSALSATPASAISVVSPNGGETWQKGSQYDIGWNITNHPINHTILIKLLKGGNFFQDIVSPGGTIKTGPYGSTGGSLPWTVPQSLPGGSDYSIQIIDQDSGGSVVSQDSSNAPFTIISSIATPAPTVDLKVNGSDSPSAVSYNSTFTVSWTSTGASCSASGHHVPLSGDGLWTGLSSLPASGSKELIARHDTYGYLTPLQLTVQCINNGVSASDTVYVPVISAPTPTLTPTITVLSPNSGDTWTQGKTYRVSWQSSGVTTANMTIMSGSYSQQISGLIGNSTSGSGSADFTVPASFPVGSAQFYLSGSNAISTKVPMTIIAAAPSTYTLSVSKSGTGSGTVSDFFGGIYCGTTCSNSYPTGGGAILTATPASGSTFTGWSGACSGTGTCTVTMDAAKSATATFAVVPIVPTSTPAPTPAPAPSTGTTVTLTASKTSITSGQSVVLTWSSTNATSCTSSGSGWPSSRYGTSGSLSSPPLTSAQTYTMTCTGSGGSATQSVTVTVTTPPNAYQRDQSLGSVYIGSTLTWKTPKCSCDASATLGGLLGGGDCWGKSTPTSDPVGSVCYDTYFDNEYPAAYRAWTYKAVANTALGLLGGANQIAGALGALGGSASDSSGPSSSFTYTWNHDLQIGSPYTADVKALQTALTKEGVYTGEITGGFYDQTYLAVKAFQQKYGINATGYVGLVTRAKLNSLYSR